MRKYEEEASTLAVAASCKALADAQITPQAVTHLVTVSCTGFHAPGFDISMIKQLGLSAGMARPTSGSWGAMEHSTP